MWWFSRRNVSELFDENNDHDPFQDNFPNNNFEGGSFNIAPPVGSPPLFNQTTTNMNLPSGNNPMFNIGRNTAFRGSSYTSTTINGRTTGSVKHIEKDMGNDYFVTRERTFDSNNRNPEESSNEFSD